MTRRPERCIKPHIQLAPAHSARVGPPDTYSHWGTATATARPASSPRASGPDSPARYSRPTPWSTARHRRHCDQVGITEAACPVLFPGTPPALRLAPTKRHARGRPPPSSRSTPPPSPCTPAPTEQPRPSSVTLLWPGATAQGRRFARNNAWAPLLPPLTSGSPWVGGRARSECHHANICVPPPEGEGRGH